MEIQTPYLYPPKNNLPVFVLVTLMNKQYFFLLLLAAAVSSCSEVVPLNQLQDIANVEWKTDGSGMLTLIEQANGDIGQTLSAAYTLSDVEQDGTLGAEYSTGTTAIQGYSYSIFMNKDGNRAITQMGAYHVYEIDIPARSARKVIPDLYLIAASDDGRFVVGSYSPPRQPIKTITIAELYTDTFRIIKQFDVNGVKNTRGIWLGNGSFAIAVNDSVGSHITVYDTTSLVLTTIGNADITNHNIHYDEDSRNLYFRNNDGNVERQNVVTGERKMIVFKATVQNFDVTDDESVAIYSILETDKGVMYKYTIATEAEVKIADDVLAGAYLSPSEDKVAYLYLKQLNYYDIKVMNFSK